MSDTYKGNKDLYKAEVVWDALKEMDKDTYNLTRLRNDKGKAINLDTNIMEIIYKYYKGKTIIIE